MFVKLASSGFVNSTTAVLTAAASGSESGVAGTVRKHPTNGMVDLPD